MRKRERETQINRKRERETQINQEREREGGRVVRNICVCGLM